MLYNYNYLIYPFLFDLMALLNYSLFLIQSSLYISPIFQNFLFHSKVLQIYHSLYRSMASNFIKNTLNFLLFKCLNSLFLWQSKHWFCYANLIRFFIFSQIIYYCFTSFLGDEELRKNKPIVVLNFPLLLLGDAFINFLS